MIEPARGVKVKKNYLYQWQTKPKKVQVKIEFENKEQNHLGIPLPKGKVRVFKADEADGAIEFVGEDLIDHTAKNEKLSLYIGDAFDITPEHTITQSSSARRKSTETHKIELRNTKDKSAFVIVEHSFASNINWTIDRTSHKHIRHDAGTLRYEVEVKANSTETIEYTFTTTW